MAGKSNAPMIEVRNLTKSFGRLKVLDVMKRLAEDGMTMIVVTHEMRFAREVSTRTMFLDSGHIEEDKPSKELFEHPQSPRLISFLEKVL